MHDSQPARPRSTAGVRFIASAVQGGVYAADGSVCSQSLQRRSYGDIVVAYDRSDILALQPQRHAGTALYAGHVYDHFGHFTLETTARLWWLIGPGAAFDGPIVLQSDKPHVLEVPYVDAFLRLLGIRERVVVSSRPLQFDRVVVPSPALELRSFAHACAHAPFRQIGQRIAAGWQGERPRKVYVSRTRLDSGLAIGEKVVEKAFQLSGYAILHPQLRPLEEQIAWLQGAERVAGVVGSGLHNLIYGEAKQVCYIGRVSSLNPNYPLIDSLLGNDALYIFAGCRLLPRNRDLEDPYLIDVRQVLRALEDNGWIEPGLALPFDQRALERHYHAEWLLQSARFHHGDRPSPALVRPLALAAAMRPADQRTVELLVPPLIEAGDVASAFQLARDFLSRRPRRPQAARRLAEAFEAAGEAKRASALRRLGRAPDPKQAAPLNGDAPARASG